VVKPVDNPLCPPPLLLPLLLPLPPLFNAVQHQRARDLPVRDANCCGL
jgi:hypothetical protein